MASSAAPHSVLPKRLAAISSRSRFAAPSAWNSACFAYGRYVASRPGLDLSALGCAFSIGRRFGLALPKLRSSEGR
jgi:hypothetical protein